MILTEITNTKTGEKLIGIEDEDFEFINPVEYFQAHFITQQLINRGVDVDEILGDVKMSNANLKLLKDIHIIWFKYLNAIRVREIPQAYLNLFHNKRKKNQVNLLKGIILTPEILESLIVRSYEEYGFTLSQYLTEHLPEGIDHTKLPLAFNNNEERIQKFGTTELSDAQLKQILAHRKVVIAKFLDKGTEWHCFFATYNSLAGRERWQNEDKPHFHYISNSFGIDRAKVVTQLTSRLYKLGNLPHIELKR